jgi:ABC-type multidrug transport system fused ATPase/permease subunit
VVGLSFDELALFVVMLLRLMPVVKSAGSKFGSAAGRWSSVERIDGQLQQFAEAQEKRSGNRVFGSIVQAIDYQDISFQYDQSETPALNKVTVSLPAHKMTALIGPSGAGKSTFVDLLPRIRDATSGRILFDGVPIEEFSLESLRAGIGYVPQQPQIMNVTAAEHIRYGKEDASLQEVREAAEVAGALGFIEALPGGFNAQLGERGHRLSGGQRQRLDIARALVRRAPILILDEPTSALDGEAEQDFRLALMRLRQETDLTIVVIAHRLSTIADADQIIALDSGRVDAVGTHAELMRSENWYSRVYRGNVPNQPEHEWA